MSERPADRVLVVVAHPDDAEFGAGGTIARLVKEGREVTYIVVTSGDKGSGDRAMTPDRLVPIREAEQRRAAGVLGVVHVEFLGYEDGEVEDTRQLRLDVTRQIRRWRPDLLITQNPHRSYGHPFSWHRDHRITARVVLDCVYPLARDHVSFPELLPDHEPHAVREVHLMRWDQPPFVVDIAATIDLKLAAIACHASQVRDREVMERGVRERAAALGAPDGLAYGEGFEKLALRT